MFVCCPVGTSFFKFESASIGQCGLSDQRSIISNSGNEKSDETDMSENHERWFRIGKSEAQNHQIATSAFLTSPQEVDLEGQNLGEIGARSFMPTDLSTNFQL